MAVEFFLKLPGIEGEATTKGFEKWIELMSFSLGVTQPHQAHSGGGMGAAKADWHDFTFSKKTDMASAKLMEAVAKGTHIQDAEVTVREAGGDNPVDYLNYKFKDLLITSYTIGGHEGGDKTDEQGSFSYSEIKKTYQSQDEKGQKKDRKEFAWSIKQNAPV